MRLSDYASEPDGIPEYFPTMWPRFVQAVLDVTIQAYIAMSSASTARLDWEEDQFTINLEGYLRSIGYHNPMRLQVRSRTPVYTAAMRAGEESTTGAKIIDLQVWGGAWHQYATVYFAWECKVVAERQQHIRNLISEYITNGMFRFLDGSYSEHVPNAGMLGYVLSGEIPNIVEAINESMMSPRRHRQLQETDALTPCPPVGTFGDIYRSSHAREHGGPPINLHHLFLTFTFPDS